MNRQTLETLVHRYFEGETTLEEEATLRKYFAENEPDNEEMARIAALFTYIKQEKLVSMPATSRAHAPKARGGSLTFVKWAAAASMIGLISVGAWMFHQYQKDQEKRIASRERLYKDHYEDPEKALLEVKAALALVGKKMNKGKSTASKGMKQVQRLHIIK
jgi:hypothetical protein